MSVPACLPLAHAILKVANAMLRVACELLRDLLDVLPAVVPGPTFINQLIFETNCCVDSYRTIALN